MEVNKKQLDQAAEVMKRLKKSEIFMNERGEFFTTENLASLSVKGDKNKIAHITDSDVKKEAAKGANKPDNTGKNEGK